VTQLGQQELMEAGPRRRIIVPEGHGAWWGVDPSTRRVAVAGVSQAADGSLVRWAREQAFAPLDGPQRLGHIHSATSDLVDGLLLDYAPLPGLVLVEQPGGTHRNYELFYATGVIIAALATSLCEAGAAKIEVVVPGWWKKRACGQGNIYKTMQVNGKPKPLPFEEYGVLRWARSLGYAGSSWDEADAWGIAEAARREVELVQR
jgi:hypothetical protein